MSQGSEKSVALNLLVIRVSPDTSSLYFVNRVINESIFLEQQDATGSDAPYCTETCHSSGVQEPNGGTVQDQMVDRSCWDGISLFNGFHVNLLGQDSRFSSTPLSLNYFGLYSLHIRIASCRLINQLL